MTYNYVNLTVMNVSQCVVTTLSKRVLVYILMIFFTQSSKTGKTNSHPWGVGCGNDGMGHEEASVLLLFLDLGNGYFTIVCTSDTYITVD